MGYTNETTHYSIPLPIGSDKTTPMDYNTSAQEVDTVLFEAKTDSASALQKANQLQQDLSTTNDNVTSVTGRVTTLEGTVTTQGQAILQNTQDIADVRADALDMIVAKDEGTAQVATVAVAVGEYFRYNDVLYIATQSIAVGDTIVPNTNCKATNVGTELNQLNNDLNDVPKRFYIDVSVTAKSNKTASYNLLNDIPNARDIISFMPMYQADFVTVPPAYSVYKDNTQLSLNISGYTAGTTATFRGWVEYI